MGCLTPFAPIDSKSEETTLVHATRHGDTWAFEELVNRHSVKLLRVACHITQNREDAEEVVQDAFLKAYTRLDQFEERASFSTWLTRIVVNESLGRLRKHRATRERCISLVDESDGEIPFDVRDWAPNPEQLYSASELQRILTESLESLRPALKVVFVLRDVAGLCGDETAEVLKLATSAVKARLFRARLQLREILSRHFGMGPAGKRLPNDEQIGPERSERAVAIPESGSAQATDNMKITEYFISRMNGDSPTDGAAYKLLTR